MTMTIYDNDDDDDGDDDDDDYDDDDDDDDDDCDDSCTLSLRCYAGVHTWRDVRHDGTDHWLRVYTWHGRDRR